MEEVDNTETLLQTVLDVSMSGIILFRPIYNETNDTIVDFSYAGLNKAAQYMLKLPQQPVETFLTLYPNAVPTGIFDFYRSTFLSEKAGRFDTNYTHDGLDNYFLLSAKRSGPLLVVSFSDTSEQDRSQVEISLREARAQIDLERQKLQHIFMQAPAMICLFEGPDHVFKLVNPPYQKLVGDRQILGLPIAVAMPELKGQPIFSLLDKVFQTGESFHAHEMMVRLDHDNSGGLGENYYNFTYQAIRDLDNTVIGILVFAYEVTSMVKSRLVTQESRRKIQVLNEELATVNEELITNNSELYRTQKLLEEFNQELESKIRQRTQEAFDARMQAEWQRSNLVSLFMQAPACICILNGPDLVYELVNPAYQQLFPGRQLLNRPIAQAMPEITGNKIYETFLKVYRTGETHEEQGLLVPIARPSDGQLEDRYFKYIQQARFNESGLIDGILVFAFEVTQQVQAKLRAEQSERIAQELSQEVAAINEELRAANEEIQSTNEGLSQANIQLVRTNVDLDTFIYTASHDLKAPVSNIEGLLSTLDETLKEQNKIDEETRHILNLMQRSVVRFKSTIVDLTEISKVQKLQEEEVSQISITDVMENVQLSIRDTIEKSGALITSDFSKVDIINFSRKNFQSILYNLLSNAIKYRNEQRRSEIRIKSEDLKQYVLLTVEDNGLGISQENQEKMFTMFKRFHNHVEGSGIGLYIVKRIVDNSGGKIEVSSTKGEGTLFKVYLKKPGSYL